jgi:hypothetical protein
MSWILSFFEFYLKTFFEGTCNYIREILSVTLKEPLSEEEQNKKVLCKNGNDFIFTISDFGLSRGFTDIDIYDLGIEWLRCGYLTVRYHQYSHLLSYFSYLILFIRIILWSSTTSQFLQAGWGDLGKGLSKLIFKPGMRPYATEAYKIKPKHYPDAEKATKGDYRAGHPVVTDLDKEVQGKVPFIAQPTHGKGSAQNPSKPLHSSEDLEGKPRPQNAVFPKEPTVLEKQWLESTSMPKSKEYLEKPEVKENIDKYSPKD